MQNVPQMLASVHVAVQAVHLGLLGLGALMALILLVWLVRTGRWRRPLAEVPRPDHGPGLLGVAAILLAFVAVYSLAAGVIVPAGATEQLAPGSDAWHRMHMADIVAKVVVSGVMAAMLWAYRRGVPPYRRPGPWHALAVAVGGWLLVLPPMALQSEMGRLVWQWLYPEVTPPIHEVLIAVRRSVWGEWGTVQLLFAAVITAPLGEELFFRGIVFQALLHHLRHGWVAIGLSSVAFGLVHAQPQDVLPLITLGLVLGALRLWSGRVWPCVVLHMLFNARTMTFVLLAPEMIPG